MTETSINVRVRQLYDSLTNWNAKYNAIPNKGEVCIFNISSKNEIMAATNIGVPAAISSATSFPIQLSKTGDNTHTLAELPWDGAIASDVYPWAKLASAPIPNIIANGSGDNYIEVEPLGGNGSVTYNISHKQVGAEYTSSNTTTSLSGLGSSNIIKIPQITVDTRGHVTSATDESVTITLPSVDGSSIVASNTGEIALKQEYIDYLDAQIYAYPAITSFDIVSGSKEVGTTLSISTFSHAESNVGNIDGNLTLKRGSTTLSSTIAPKSSSTSVSITDSVTPTSAQTITYTLSGTDTRGNLISKTDSINFYFPSFVGASASTTVTPSTVTSSFTKVASSSLSGTKSIPANTQYVYFITTSNISSIKGTNGFAVTYSKLNDITLSINGVNKVYNVYRTDNLLTETLDCVIA